MNLEIILIFIFSVLGYFIQKLISGKYEGDKIERSLRLSTGKYYLHIHHWIYYFLIIIILYVINFYNPIIYGLIIGGIIQGLTYRDRFVIIYRKKDFKKIYSKWQKQFKLS